jgi:hypothetical protein
MLSMGDKINSKTREQIQSTQSSVFFNSSGIFVSRSANNCICFHVYNQIRTGGGFTVIDQLLTRYSAFIMYWRTNGRSGTVHQVQTNVVVEWLTLLLRFGGSILGPGDRLSWLKLFVVFLSPSRKYRNSILKLVHDHFPPKPFQFTAIHLFYHRRYIV